MANPTVAGFWTGSISYTDPYGNANAITFGSVDEDGIFWYWLGITGWDSADTSGSVVQRTSDHGGWATPQYFAPRQMTWTIFAQAPDQATRDLARQKLQAACPVSDLATFLYNEPVPKMAMVRRQGEIVETALTLSEVTFTITLVAPDPRKYRSTQRAFTVNALTTPAGSFRLPWSAPVGGPGLAAYGAGTGTIESATLNTQVSKGDGIIVVMSTSNSTAQTVTCADSQTNSYTQQAALLNSTSTANSLWVFTATANADMTPGTDTFTVTTTHSEAQNIAVYRVPHFISVGPVTTNTGASAAPTVTTGTPAAANGITFSVFGNASTQKATAPTGWGGSGRNSNSAEQIDAFFLQTAASVASTAAYGSSSSYCAVSICLNVANGLFSGNEITLPNSGNFATRPVITVYGPCSNPTLISTVTGQSVTFTGLTLASAADILTIDFDNRSATRNGATCLADIPSSWWEVPPGGGTDFIFGGQFTAGSKAVVTYRDAFI